MGARASSKDQRECDRLWMARCLDLAALGLGYVSPNPLVGAVVVRGNKVLAEGFHHRLGGDHAEIDALRKINFKATGATLYCNLEPCFHEGRTPPCVHRLISSGIRRVVIAHPDPNPRVAGKSIKLLRQNKIEVVVGVLEKEARFMNRVFLTWITQKRPYVFLKAAVSLDGKITPAGKKTGWITGPQARLRVHQIRSQVDAVLVGRKTVQADNPRLNVRGFPKARQPQRVILDSNLRLSSQARILKSAGGLVLIATHRPSEPKQASIERPGVEILSLKKDRKGLLLNDLLSKLADREISSLLVEGGSEVFSSFLQKELVDEIIFHVAPQWLGEKALPCFGPSVVSQKSWPFTFLECEPLGPDVEIRYIKDSIFR